VLATQITDHVDQALGRLLQQYVDRPNFAALITSLVSPLQDLENAIYGIDAARQITNPDIEGVQIDGIGQIVGRARNGLSDAEYLLFIFGQIGVNNSDSTINTASNILALIYNSQWVQEQDLPPAALALQVAGTIEADFLATVAAMVQQSLGAAIELDWIAQYDPTLAFAFDGGTEPALGFGDANDPQMDNGGFADVVWRNTVT
jgi:hypothetical protein